MLTVQCFLMFVIIKHMLQQKLASLHADLHLQYYVEPGTGQRFRSLRAVERHLRETNGTVFVQFLWFLINTAVTHFQLSCSFGCQSKNISDEICFLKVSINLQQNVMNLLPES